MYRDVFLFEHHPQPYRGEKETGTKYARNTLYINEEVYSRRDHEKPNLAGRRRLYICNGRVAARCAHID